MCLIFPHRFAISMPISTLLRERFAAIDQHFHQVVIALWQGPGWNAELALPYEALDHQGAVLPVTRYRAMACARQLYVFTTLIGDARHPYAPERAAALFRSLNKHFHDAEHGGWFYSVDAQGAPLETQKDLYTHAFIIFACAHYFRVSADKLAEATLDAALEVVARHFACGPLYHAALTRNWQDAGKGALQNPLMHLTEALLAVLAARTDQPTEQRLLALCDGMAAHFIDANGLLMEKPVGALDNWFEPGHQFEWLYLLETSALLSGHPLRDALRKAFAFSERQGLAASGAVLAALDTTGKVLDANQRIWAQTEHLRALTLAPVDQTRLLNALSGFAERYLHASGWNESLDATGAINRLDLPSTTAYHLATGYAAVSQYLAD